MTKELIISANVHEKKVAILEDGLVTEFYVERSDENQGVVGNLYKGRVMKVLPGMQSAFVDIALERDAFLYVSDFAELMEDEELIEFPEAGPAGRPEQRPEANQRRFDRRDERTRPPVDRPARYQGGVRGGPPPHGERAALEAASADTMSGAVSIEDVVEQLAEIVDESVIPPPQREEEPERGFGSESSAEAVLEAVRDLPGVEEVETGTGGPPQAGVVEAAGASDEEGDVAPVEKGDRSRSRKKGQRVEAAKPGRRSSKKETAAAAPGAAPAAAGKRAGRRRSASSGVMDESADAAGDQEPPAAEAGRMPDDMYLFSEEDARFERVTDEDLAQIAGEMLKDAIVQEKIIDRVHDAEYQQEVGRPITEERSPELEPRVGSLRSQLAGDSGFLRVVDEETSEAAEQLREIARESDISGFPGQTESDEGIGTEELRSREWFYERTEEEDSGSTFSRAGEYEAARNQLEYGADGESDAAARSDSARSLAGGHANEEGREEYTGGDAQAEVRDRGRHGEFAVRRGGRGRRRRPREAPPAAGDENTQAEAVEPAASAPEEETASAAEPEPLQAEAPQEAQEPRQQAQEPQPAESVTQEPLPPASSQPDVRREEPRHQDSRRNAPRPRDNRRPPPPRRPEPRPPEAQRRAEPRPPEAQRRPEPPPRPAPRYERGGVPTISDLLREGQEILVQIAKEPIAKKGARITSHIALPGRYVVYMPTVNHIGVSRKIASEMERVRLKRLVTSFREREGASGGFIVRTACEGHSEQELLDDVRYLLRTWADVRKKAERSKSPALVHRDLDLVQRILRDHLSDEFSAIRVDSETEYARLVEFVNRIQPKLVKRVKLFVGDQPILEKYGVQPEIDKAVKPRVWLRSGGYIVINQTEALVAIDVNTGKFVGKSDRLEDTITRTNMEAVKEIIRQIRLRDLGGIIVLDLIDMEERKNRQRVMAALQQELQADRAPSKILSINDFGLVAITRKRVKQSLERTLCTPCPYCQGAGLVKSSQTMCFEILEQAKAISKQANRGSDVTLRVSPDVAEAFRSREREVMDEIEAYFHVPITIEADVNLHREQYDFAIV
ncbi:MAG TPA: Rne/Rng family ribonuclease [Blastocatellia bacterium]|nr:Rne/Rng family ribonuclease [Blastocatellia bacterium]